LDLSLLTTAVVAMVLTVVLTALVLPYARGRLIDVPADRSSHATPTPTGGGVGIVVVLLIVLLGLGWRELMSPLLAVSSAVGLLLVAAVGWADDHRHLAPAWRLIAQLLAGILVVWALGGVEQLGIGELTLTLGITGSVLAVIACMWLINLYNFMDGVDGLAAIEGVFVSGVMAAIFWIEGESGAALLAASLAGGCLGFLFWNWPPARIFLGDVGSYSIGFTLAALALYGELTGSLPLAVFGILAAIFIVDATYTLISRMGRRSRWYTAHREHAYQAPVAAGVDHGRVVLAISLVNVLMLLPLALAVWLNATLTPAAVAGVAVSGWVVWFLIRRRYR
jgi:Fuc2NAc and GlcNAc transferase